MKYRSVFDIIGPVMIGPSSSHTAGAARIGRAARTLFGRKPKCVVITLYGSFAKTYRGHGTDIALVGGLLDFDTFDPRIPDSLHIASREGMQVTFIPSNVITDHPNTVRLRLQDGQDTTEVVGVSVGGGKIELSELNGFRLRCTGENPVLFVLHQDRYGMVAQVAVILAQHQINIGYMHVSRKEKGLQAMMSIETDQSVSMEVQEELRRCSGVLSVIAL